jgi:hypothetical protein
MTCSHHSEACLGSNGLTSHVNDLGAHEIRARTVLYGVATCIVFIDILVVSQGVIQPGSG